MEAIRTLRVARRSAVKGRTQAINQLEALVLTGPAELRQALAGQSTRHLQGTCRRLRTEKRPADATDPVTAATKITWRRLARRIVALTEEIDAELRPLVDLAAPMLVAVYGVGTEVAAQLLITAGDNPRPTALRGRPRPALRHSTPPGQQRAHHPPPTQPGRRPTRKLRPAHHRPGPAVVTSADAGLRRPATSRRPEQP
jgi:hypothetical protein